MSLIIIDNCRIQNNNWLNVTTTSAENEQIHSFDELQRNYKESQNDIMGGINNQLTQLDRLEEEMADLKLAYSLYLKPVILCGLWQHKDW